MKKVFLLCLLISFSIAQAQTAQVLTLKTAIQQAIDNYETIKARRNYMNASGALVKNTKNEYLPSLTAAAQIDYGTVNGQFGVLSGNGGYAVASGGPVTSAQSWDAAFGSLYLINANWEFLTFGRLRSKIKASKYAMLQDSAALVQEQFIQGVKAAGAYLNLLAAQELLQNAQANLDRVVYVQQTVRARTLSGLNPGVDSSIANAQLSAAKLQLIDADTRVLETENQLAEFMNVPPDSFKLDTTLITGQPADFNGATSVDQNPQVKFYQARIDQSSAYTKYIRNSILPGLNLFGIAQTRGSGFDYNYLPEGPLGYSRGLGTGLDPTRSNYLLGVAIAWNIISPFRIKQQVNAQKYITAAYQNEYNVISESLKDQLILADQRINNSIKSLQEVPIEYKAANDAYIQKGVSYKNGLTNIVDLQQALYALNKAETDVSVAHINVWQALLLKSAASGDFDLFIKQVK